MFAQGILEVRNSKLYRLEHDTFEAFCQTELGISKTRSYELMGAAETVQNLTTFGIPNFLPKNEGQTNPLVKLEPEVQRVAWAQVLESNAPETITAKKVGKFNAQ